MHSNPCLALLAAVLSLATQAAYAADCPAKSSGFADIAAALNKAASCLKAMQIQEACEYSASSDLALCRGASGRLSEACQNVESRVDELNAIVKKKCDAEAAKSPTPEQCPAKSTDMDEIIAVLNEAKSCERAIKVFQACEYGTSGDIRFGAVVERKCEADFLGQLREPQKLAYQRQLRLCDRKYANEQGTMYRSFAAFCRAEVAQRYSRQALKGVDRSRSR
jgi:hypothetical protein